jgi:aryl-alcohol dehydrogenase-like predicted oxidoreductase
MEGSFKRRTGQHFSERAYDVLDVVMQIAEEKNATPSQVALAWVNQKAGVTSVIIGPRTMEQFEDNLGAIDVHLTAEDHAKIDEVAEPELATVPYYHGSMINFKPSEYSWL